MGDSPSSDDTGQSDEQIEAQERFDDQQTGNFSGGNTNVSDPGDSGGFAGDTPQARRATQRQYERQQGEVRTKAFMGGVPGFFETLNPTTQLRHQTPYSRRHNEV